MRITSTNDVAKLTALRCEPQRVAHVRGMIAKAGILLRGHFQLQSGAHSEYFLRVRGLAAAPELLDEFAHELLQIPPGLGSAAAILCPESAGFLLGDAIARAANVPVVVSKTDMQRRPSNELRLGALQPATDVLLVNDVATSGASLGMLLRTARAHGADARRALTLATLGTAPLQTLNDIGLAGTWLIECQWPLYPADSCALCKRDLPLILSAELG